MNCPCGVHVPAGNEQRSCIAHYFVTGYTIHKNILYLLPSKCTSVGYCVYYYFSDMHWLIVTAIVREIVDTSSILQMNVFKAVLSGHNRYISKVTSFSPFTGHHQTYTRTHERSYTSSICAWRKRSLTFTVMHETGKKCI
jgi:hypothetical protein